MSGRGYTGHMTTTTRTFKAIAKCSKGHTVTADSMLDAVAGWLPCPCGAKGMAKSFEVKVTEHKCGAKCTSALGGSCFCSCAGENHGADHRY